MAERRRRYTVKCHECNTEYKAKKSNAMYCSNACRQKAQYRKYKNMKKIEMEGPAKIDPYFLTRGDICKNLSTGISLIGGAA
jgi:uncharacterized Zn ribbon protein